MGVFHVLKMYKWYQIAQNVTILASWKVTGYVKKHEIEGLEYILDWDGIQ